MPVQYVYLASASPRRRDLLAQIGVPFRVLGVAVDEAALAAEAPADYVTRLAVAKAEAGWRRSGVDADVPAAPVLGADTAVVIDGRILGKPRDRADALDMLGALAGRTHAVYTAVALRTGDGTAARLSRSEVRLRSIDAAELTAYWQTGEPSDKAGAYAVQGFGAIFVQELRGSYSGVMGLPIFETAGLLRAAGVPLWSGA
jgi:septum formation protein